MLLGLMLEIAAVHIFCPWSARGGGSRRQCGSPAPWNRQNGQLGHSSCALASFSGKFAASLIPRASPASVYIWPQLFLFVLHYFFPLSATSLPVLVSIERERSNQHSLATRMLF